MSYKTTLKKWIPPHFKESQYIPLIDSMGTILDDLRVKLDEFFDETFISLAEDTLPLHAEERGISRIKYQIGGVDTEETDQDFRNRIQRIKYTCSIENIKDNARSVSLIQDIEIIPDFDAFPRGDEIAELVDFSAKGRFGNYGPLDLKKRHKCFSVLIEAPIRRPLSFLDKDTFLDKNAFLDREDRLLDALTISAMQTLIRGKSPAGSGHRLLIKGFSGEPVGDEASQENALNSLS